MCTGMKENLMASKMRLFFWAIRKKHLETRKHCGLFSAPMYHYQPMKSCPVTYVGGQSKYFPGSARINWHWAAARYALHRESGGTGCWCHWHIIYVLQELVNSALSKPDITGSVILSSRNSIGICFNVQGKAMTLTHLWNWQCSFVQFFKFAHL